MAKTKTANINCIISEDIIKNNLPVRENMTNEEFDSIMARGINEAKFDLVYDVDECFDEIVRGL